MIHSIHLYLLLTDSFTDNSLILNEIIFPHNIFRCIYRRYNWINGRILKFLRNIGKKNSEKNPHVNP